MTKWGTVRLGEALRHRKEFITIDDVTSYRRPRVQLHAQGVVLRDEVPGALIKTKTQQVCRAGEFLVAEIDAKVGGFGIVPQSLDGAIVSSHYFLFEIDDAKLDRRFLDFYVRTAAFSDQVTAQGSTNYAAIRPAHVLGYRVPLPTLSEQRRVVALIEELAVQVYEARALRRAARAEAKALVESALARIFDGLGSRRLLGDVCDTTSGGTPSRDRLDFYQGDIPWVKSGELEDDIIRYASERISESAVKNSSAKVFPSGTLLVALYGATVGKTGVLGMDAATNQAVCGVFPKKGVDRDYLWWFLRRMRPKFLERSFGGAQPNISQKVLRETEVPIPSLADQRHIVAQIDAFQSQANELMHHQAETAAAIDALLPVLLDRAFKGALL